ncbi:MAG: glucose-1-phosphate thymidylyltransferase [Pseudomonadota bacterium]
MRNAACLVRGGLRLLSPEDFFDLERFSHRDLFSNLGLVWEALPRVKEYLARSIPPGLPHDLPLARPLDRTLIMHQGRLFDAEGNVEIVSGDATKGKMAVLKKGKALEGASVLYAGSVFFDSAIAIGEGVVVEPGALIKGPTIVGNRTEIRQGAYIRGSCLIGARCVVGHVTEMKNSLMLDDAKAGHFAYLGDSILGFNCNLGAGTKLANLRFISNPITLSIEGKAYQTGLRKLGAIAGDEVQTGCNSVTNPGSILGRGTFVYPNITVAGGYYRPGSIIRK